MSLLGDFHANHLAQQEKEKEQKMTDTYFQKCLESLKRLKQGGLLERMCKELLICQREKSCKEYTMIWKPSVTKSKLLLFQLVRKELGTKETESGSLLPTPTLQDSRIGINNIGGNKHRVKRGSVALADKILFPTPTAGCAEGGEQSHRVERSKTGKGFILRKKNKPNNTYGAKLSDTMLFLEKQKYPTPTTSDAKDIAYNPITCKREIVQQKMSIQVLKNNKPGGKLNSLFVEFLMGFPMNWTKIELTELNHLETQLYHKSQQKLAKPLLKQKKKMYRTPTAMDTNNDSFVYAAKILNGKTVRKSNEKVQKTLSMDIAMEYLKDNPELINQLDQPFKVRPNLPDKIDFINYLKSQTNIKELTDKTDIKKTTIEHWFRKDKCFAYPTVESWNIIKKFFSNLKFDYEMTHEVEEDWKI